VPTVEGWFVFKSRAWIFSKVASQCNLPRAQKEMMVFTKETSDEILANADAKGCWVQNNRYIGLISFRRLYFSAERNDLREFNPPNGGIEKGRRSCGTKS